MKKYIRIIALVLAVILVIAAVFVLRSCSAPPKYEEIEGRFKELVEASKGVNKIIFGEGLPTYERISDPKSTVSIYKTGEYYMDDGEEKERKVWYYYTLEEKNTVVAFRDSYLKEFSYALVSGTELSEKQLSELYPAPAGDNSQYYGEVYRSDDGKDICYLIPYAEKDAEFYYSSQDAEDYDFVRFDCDYPTIDSIKKYTETVYSRNYAASVYGTLFDGVASGDLVLKARYTEISREGTLMLAKSNTYKPLYTEDRVYLYDTAEILYWESSAKDVFVSIDTYLPSAPDKIQNMVIALTLQNGQWILDSPTF